MMPYFIPPPTGPHHHHSRGHSGHARSCSDDTTNADSLLDPTLMTPPMSPTEHTFDFASTINSRFDASTLSSSYSSASTTAYRHNPQDQQHFHPLLNFSLDDLYSSPSTDRTSYSSASYLGTSSPASSNLFSAVSPRPVSFHWEDYHNLEEDRDDSDSDQDDLDFKDGNNQEDDDQDEGGQEVDDEHEESVRLAYQRQFEGHHSLVRRRSSFGGRGNGGGHGVDSFSEDSKYDSMRHGIGQSVSDVSEELAKARMAMYRASQAMKSMEMELEAMQMSIDESKASSASARTAIEENFWRLECLARTLEKDKQDMNKQLQAVGRDCHQAVETVTNWEVRIDWLGRRVDNTSEYVSELVLSEQECMSFIKMIIQQNQRYALPAISRATERNIKLMAPPKPREIAQLPIPPSITPSPSFPIQSPPSPQPQPPPFTSNRIPHIPISWLLEPILPPKPPEISPEQAAGFHQKSSSSSDPNTAPRHGPMVEPPAEVWRDFSRLTRAFESGQTRTPFSMFQRTRTRSASQGQGYAPGMPGAGFQSGANNSNSNNNNGANSSGSIFKQAMRRPQVDGLSPMPKILPPAVAATKMPNIKRRSQNLSHLPVHSWLQFQFNKTMTTPGPLGSGKKKKTSVLGFQPITIFQTTADNLPFVPRRNNSKR
ncbi:hypothetical protein BGX23_007352 [Mortierella sp. AD031]|nr:hypothetical protein BGX23_007352 [Mortierella sp. AD031]